MSCEFFHHQNLKKFDWYNKKNAQLNFGFGYVQTISSIKKYHLNKKNLWCTYLSIQLHYHSLVRSYRFYDSHMYTGGL